MSKLFCRILQQSRMFVARASIVIALITAGVVAGTSLHNPSPSESTRAAASSPEQATTTQSVALQQVASSKMIQPAARRTTYTQYRNRGATWINEGMGKMFLDLHYTVAPNGKRTLTDFYLWCMKFGSYKPNVTLTIGSRTYRKTFPTGKAVSWSVSGRSLGQDLPPNTLVSLVNHLTIPGPDKAWRMHYRF